MNTYVVENVLCDYTCGLIVVKVKSKEDAIEMIINKIHNPVFYCQHELNNRKYLSEKIRELKDNEVVYVNGGA